MNTISIAMDNILDVNNEKWFYDYVENVLFSIDFEKKVLFPWAGFSRWKFDKFPKIYGKTIFVNKKIYLVPEASIPIAVYELEKQSIYYIDYKIECYDSYGKIFAGAIAENKYIYFIPCFNKSIIRLDTTCDELEYYPINTGYCFDGCKPAFLYDGFIRTENGFLFSTFHGNKVLSFDFLTNNVKLELELPENSGIHGLAGKEDDYIIIPIQAKKLYRYIRSAKQLIEINSFPKGYEYGEWSFSKILYEDEKWVLLPRDSNMLLMIEGTEIKCLNQKKDTRDDGYFSRYYYYSICYKYNDEWLFFCSQENGAVCYDKKMRLIGKRKFFLPDLYYDCAKKDNDGEIVIEGNIWNLKWFVNHI